METPIGKLKFLFNSRGLIHVLFDNDTNLLEETKHIPLNNNHLSVKIVENIFTQYFTKKEVDFSSIPIRIAGTSLQKEVFKALYRIKYGEVISYKDFTHKFLSPHK